jgi:(2Fe-2S) ferredoxin
VGHKRKRTDQDRPTCVTAGLMVCTGKDCRKSKGWSDLVHLAASTVRAHEVPCQGLCKGPVVGLAIDGKVRWFGHVRSGSKRDLVTAMSNTGRVPDELGSRESRKRRGEMRGRGRMHPLDPHRAEALTS